MGIHDRVKNLKFLLGAAVGVALLFVGFGCAKDVTPPVIQQIDAPEWAVEGENVILNVRTSDDSGVSETYVEFSSGDKTSLSRLDRKKSGEEIANWQATWKLVPGDYPYTIVAQDKAGNRSDPKEGNITVYPKDSLHGYAWNKGIDEYLSQLANLEKNGIVDANGKAFVDLLTKYQKAGELVPRIYAEILKLPDLMAVDGKDIEAAEDILGLANEPDNKDAFQSMLSEGIPDKRKYCSPLEGLLWIAFDNEFDATNNPLRDYSVDKFISDAWYNTTISRKYTSARWKNFNEVVDRLNSPQLVAKYCLDNISYDAMAITLGMAGVGSKFFSPEETFARKRGCCTDQARFVMYCLEYGGYSDDEFSINKENGICLMHAGPRGTRLWHDACIYTQDGNLYVIDVGTNFTERGIKGPFKTEEQAADAMYPGWSSYYLRCTGKTAFK